MRRALCVTVLSAGALLVAAPVALADPAIELPSAACNAGTAHALIVSGGNSMPLTPHGHHGCHIHPNGWFPGT